MFEKVNKSCTIFACPNVILQWYYLLRELNLYYPAGDDEINRILNLVEKNVDYQKNPITIIDKASIRYEQNLSSDVSGNQQ